MKIMSASLTHILSRPPRIRTGFKMTETFKTAHHAEEITQQQLIDLLVESVIVRDSRVWQM